MSDVRPPVEPMSDLSWARVERGLWARLDTATTHVEPGRSRRTRWIVLPAIAVAAVAAAVIALVIDTPATTAPVAVVEEHPMRVVSGSAPSTITVGDAHVTLAEDSALVMPRATDMTSTAVLERGAAWFAIAPRTSRQFVVVAGDAVVRVIGTKFRVSRFEERVTVEVERGVVDVTFQGTTIKIADGETWSSEAPSTTTAQVIEAPAPTTIEAPKQTKRSITKPTPTLVDEQAKFEGYAALEARNPNGAIAGYLEVARGTSIWAQLSLYAAARLAADRGEARAKTLLDMYLRRFPRGANAADARQLLDRLKGAL